MSATCLRDIQDMSSTCPCLVSLSSPPKTFFKKTFPAKSLGGIRLSLGDLLCRLSMAARFEEGVERPAFWYEATGSEQMMKWQ